VPEKVFRFTTTRAKVGAFVRWLRRQYNKQVLEPLGRPKVHDGEHYTATYIRRAYDRGWRMARGRLRTKGVAVGKAVDPFNIGISKRQLRRLYTRTYENLASIRDDMAPIVRDTLTEGIAEGRNPRRLADKLTREIRGIQHSQAEVLARTEVVHSHVEASLDRYERAGVDTVSHTEWLAADDTRTCPFCRRLDGVHLTLSEMRGTAVEWRGQVYRLAPPAHPNGRCSPAPMVGADPPQKRLSKRVPGTIITR